MDRRRFLYQVTAATAAGAAGTLGAVSASRPGVGQAQVARETPGGTPGTTATRDVRYQVKGFTCITCAVGLEVMLRGLKGVTRADASYPAGTVVVGFDARVTSGDAIGEFIAACGFSIA